jgi:hypothetical protein
MLKRSLVVLVGLFALMLSAQAALAVSPHVKSGPSFTDNGLTLSATVSYAGLGNFNTEQVLTAQGNPTATCTNPSGANKPPGQNPAAVTLTGATNIPAAQLKNGNVTIATTTGAPTSPIPGAPGCPGTNWTETITDVAFTSATIQLFQDANNDGIYQSTELVLTLNCTFSPATANGPVPSSGFTCS